MRSAASRSSSRAGLAGLAGSRLARATRRGSGPSQQARAARDRGCLGPRAHAASCGGSVSSAVSESVVVCLRFYLDSRDEGGPCVSESSLLALQLCVDARVLLRAQHLPRTRTCRAAHTQHLASCGAPLRSERAAFGAHGGRADATSSLSRYSSGCPWLIFQNVSRSEKPGKKFVSPL